MTDAEKIVAMKVVIKQAIEMHVPKDERRDPRWTRLVNALFTGIVRVAGPFK